MGGTIWTKSLSKARHGQQGLLGLLSNTASRPPHDTHRWNAAPPSGCFPRAAVDCAGGHVRCVSSDCRSSGGGSGLVWYLAAAVEAPGALSSDPVSLAAASAELPAQF